MGHLFSKKNHSKVTEEDRAVLQLKTTRDKIHQYQKRSEKTIEKDRSLAKQLLQNGRKDRAKLLLRKKKFIEEQLGRTDTQLEKIEQMIQSIEYAQIEVKVVDSLKIGNEALHQINEILNIEDIERILDETLEASEKQRELDDLLSGRLTSEEEDLVEDELAALLADALMRQLPDASKERDVEITEGELPDVEMDDVELPEVPQMELDTDTSHINETPKKTKTHQKERVALPAS